MGNKEEIEAWLKNRPDFIIIEKVNFYHEADSILNKKLLSTGTKGEIEIFIIGEKENES